MQAINTIVLWIIAIFAVLGIIERIVREWAPDLELPLIAGWGAEMEEGFNAMGPLALAMVGIIALAPVLSQILVPIVGPIYTALLSKPAMFAGTLLAIDNESLPLRRNLCLYLSKPQVRAGPVLAPERGNPDAPDNAAAHHALGLSLVRSGAADDALAELEAAACAGEGADGG